MKAQQRLVALGIAVFLGLGAACGGNGTGDATDVGATTASDTMAIISPGTGTTVGTTGTTDTAGFGTGGTVQTP